MQPIEIYSGKQLPDSNLPQIACGNILPRESVITAALLYSSAGKTSIIASESGPLDISKHVPIAPVLSVSTERNKTAVTSPLPHESVITTSLLHSDPGKTGIIASGLSFSGELDRAARSRTIPGGAVGLDLYGLSGLSRNARLTRIDQELGKLYQSDYVDNGMRQRDRMALTSIAFGSPLLLLCLGATLALSDDQRLNRASELFAEWRRCLLPLAGRPIQEQTEKMKQSCNLSMSFDVSGRMIVERKVKQRKPGHDRPVFAPVSVNPVECHHEKSWQKASKVLKQKKALTEFLEQNRDHLDVDTVFELIAKIEILDKKLKKMG